jgi:hypothetical protein
MLGFATGFLAGYFLKKARESQELRDLRLEKDIREMERLGIL